MTARATAPAGTAIASVGLTKRFAARRPGRAGSRAAAAPAVDGVDLHVPSGSVYGFLGPNGSGKTTTIRMLLGLVFPSAGQHTLLGRDFASHAPELLPRVGALVEGPAMHPYLSGRANLARLDAADRHADARTAPARIEAALERVGLAAAAAKRYRVYSLGMRQRLGIAAALLRPRDLLVLDEPTNGLDPQGTREIRGLIGELAADGVTVFVSSHLLGEVAQMCTHVGVMSRGRLVWQGALDELTAGRSPRVRIDTGDVDRAARVLAAAGLVAIERRADGLRADLHGVEPEAVVRALVGAGVAVRGFVVETPDLEERFVGLTGEGFDVSG